MVVERKPNRLVHESSLYLRQHANNPVDWFPWGDEAIAKAKAEQKPIFLSIGYSACHWCHVMEHESFEDESTAAYLNSHFVCIKVDREERPDLDTIYMSALQAMTREGGGWPLSVWLTPDLHPFYAGTYFPPDNRYAPQRPSFRGILAALVDAWETKRPEILEKSGQVVEYLKNLTPHADSSGGELSVEMLKQVCDALPSGIDRKNGGFGRAPKFPHALELQLLLRGYERFEVPAYLEAVELTLQKMARGGIYDQIGGGFHRYSVDAEWLVPHFEKMLYDNALLVPLYLEAWQITRNPFYADIARETLEYVNREMTSESGGFFSAQDADSEGEEGKFYVWSLAEIEKVLGPDDGPWFAAAYDITASGNFEGHNIPNRNGAKKPLPDHIQDNGIRERLESCKAKLLAVRSQRIWPGRDEKVLSAWNGLLISAYARAGAVLGEEKYAKAAERAAEFVLSKLLIDAELFRTCSETTPAKIAAYLEDYSFLAAGCLDLFSATQEIRWLRESIGLTEAMLERFWDESGKGFYFTQQNQSDLITRTKEMHDGSTPAGNSVAVMVLVRLANLLHREDYRIGAMETLQAYRNWMLESPGGAGQLLIALDYYLGPPKQMVLVGSNDEEVKIATKALSERFAPRSELVIRNGANAIPDELKELLAGRGTLERKITLYICERFTCQAPIVGIEAIRKALEKKI